MVYIGVNMMNFSLALGLCLLLATVSGYPYFRDLIPNGKKVPHPCKPNYVWKGVGHENQAGGGSRNPFGTDWDANGKQWDECLCRTDSDGDGRTNGEELGDPDCTWTPGDVPETAKGLSHPGVCEPLDDPVCIERNYWELDCSSLQFTCDPLEETQDVRTVVVKLDDTPVPPQETTYMCQLVELPSDGDYHIIASEPYIDNEYVMHHLLLYGCDDDIVPTIRAEFSSPKACGMEAFSCSTILDGWTIGSAGACLPEEYGTRIGSSGYKYALLEMHWNNPEERDDYTDGSGLTLYYTPDLREYDGSSIFVGPAYLEIPPGYSQVINKGGCTSRCTKRIFSETIKVSSISPHMHYMGRKMTVELVKNGISAGIVLEETDYNYDSPQDYLYDPPLEVEPGDEIIVTCSFDSSGNDAYIFYGDATSDEMCLATVSYYPRQPNEDNCVNNGEIGFCGGDVGTNQSAVCYQEVETGSMFVEGGVFWTFWETLALACDPSGLECFPTCPDALEQVRQQHVCFQGSTETAFKALLTYTDELHPFIQLLVSCDERPEMYYKPAVEYTPAPGGDEGLCGLPISKGDSIRFNALWILGIGVLGKMGMI